MSTPTLDPSRYAQGLATYKAGHGLATVFGLLASFDAMHEEVERKFETTGDSPEAAQAFRAAHEAIDNATPSFLVGFLEGFLTDFRALTSADDVRARKQDSGLTA